MGNSVADSASGGSPMDGPWVAIDWLRSPIDWLRIPIDWLRIPIDGLWIPIEWLSHTSICLRAQPVPTLPCMQPRDPVSKLVLLHFVGAATAGHYLTGRCELPCGPKLHAPSLQMALLQTAALQLQASSLPVAAHALGLVTSWTASTQTTLPL